MKKHIDEVLYSISPDTVVARRYNPILGIVITVAAAVAIAQTLEYVPHEYQPVSEAHLFEQGKFTVADFM